MKNQDLDPKDSEAQNPYCILLHKLMGASSQCPRLKSAANVWHKTVQIEIEAMVKQKDIPWVQMAKFRDQTAREMFSELSEDEKQQWREQAKDEHEEALKNWELKTEATPSMVPEDRQRYCFQVLASFGNQANYDL